MDKEFVSAKLVVVGEDLETESDYRVHLNDLIKDPDDQTILEVAQAFKTIIRPAVTRVEIVKTDEIYV